MDERQVRQFVIGALSKLKKPKMPYVKGISEILNELSGVTIEQSVKNRQQLIDTTLDDLKALSPFIESWLETACRTVIGNEQTIKDNSDEFVNVSALL